MFWAMLELKWHCIGVQSQPKVRVTSCAVSQSSLHGAGSHGGEQSYPRFLSYGAHPLSAPSPEVLQSLGGKKLQKKNNNFPFSSSTAIFSSSDHRASNCYSAAGLEQESEKMRLSFQALWPEEPGGACGSRGLPGPVRNAY